MPLASCARFTSVMTTLICLEGNDTSTMDPKQSALNEVWSSPSEETLHRYHWSVLELIDQLVRTKSGGLMLELLKSGRFDTEYVRYRNATCSPNSFRQ